MPGTSSPDKPTIDEAALDAAFEKASPVSIRNKRGARKLVEDYLEAVGKHPKECVYQDNEYGFRHCKHCFQVERPNEHSEKCPDIDCRQPWGFSCSNEFHNQHKHSDDGKGYGILQCTVCGEQVLSLDHECTKTRDTL